MNRENSLKDIQNEIDQHNFPPLLSREFVQIKDEQKMSNGFTNLMQCCGKGNKTATFSNIDDYDDNDDDDDGDDKSKNSDGKTLRIFQWNILAQALCQGLDNFVLCPQEALEWNYRRLRMLEELHRNDASIYCLQEVDCFNVLKEHFRELKFDGVFYPKPESPCLDQEVNTGPDGCAIFYDEEKFRLLDTHKINLKKNENLITNQVAILCKFEGIKEKVGLGTFFIAVTHLKAKPGYEKLRQAQGRHLLQILKQEVGEVPLILTGDFNASHKEPVYGEIMKSDLQLSSVYTFLSPNGAEPPFTTWQVRGSYCGHTETCVAIDYIFFSKNHFSVKSVLDIPSEREIGKTKLPSQFYPSDHLSLVCDLEIK